MKGASEGCQWRVTVTGTGKVEGSRRAPVGNNPSWREAIVYRGIMLPSAATALGSPRSVLSIYAPTPSWRTCGLVGMINEIAARMPMRASATVLQGSAVTRR